MVGAAKDGPSLVENSLQGEAFVNKEQHCGHLLQILVVRLLQESFDGGLSCETKRVLLCL